MSATAFFSELDSVESSRSLQLDDQWDQLVIDLADGEKPDPEEVSQLLRELKRTPLQLKAEVNQTRWTRAVIATVDGEKLDSRDLADLFNQLDKSQSDLDRAAMDLANRRRLREKLDSDKANTAEHERINAAIAAANAELEKAKGLHAGKMRVLIIEQREASRESEDIRESRRQLIEYCDGPRGERLKAAQAKRVAALKEQDELQRNINNLLTSFGGEHRGSVRWTRLMAEVESLKTRLDANKAGYSELQQAAAAAETACLEP